MGLPSPALVASVLATHSWSKVLAVTTVGATPQEIDPFVEDVITVAAQAGVALKGVRVEDVYFPVVNAPAFHDAKLFQGIVIVRSPNVSDVIEFVVQ